MLPDKGLVLGEQRQAGIVRFAQRLTVDHRVHMGDRRPDAAQSVIHLLQRGYQVIPGKGFALLQHIVDALFAVGNGHFDGGFDMFRPDLAKRRQPFHG